MGYNMKINFTDDKFLDLGFHYTGTGTQANCTHEPYTFQSWGDDQKMTLTNFKDDNDCLGINLRRHDEFADGYFTYNAARNELIMHHDSTTAELNPAMCDCVAEAP